MTAPAKSVLPVPISVFVAVGSFTSHATANAGDTPASARSRRIPVSSRSPAPVARGPRVDERASVHGLLPDHRDQLRHFLLGRLGADDADPLGVPLPLR